MGRGPQNSTGDFFILMMTPACKRMRLGRATVGQAHCWRTDSSRREVVDSLRPNWRQTSPCKDGARSCLGIMVDVCGGQRAGTKSGDLCFPSGGQRGANTRRAARKDFSGACGHGTEACVHCVPLPSTERQGCRRAGEEQRRDADTTVGNYGAWTEERPPNDTTNACNRATRCG
ncbi:hypothetical protein TRVL_06385 [Trypanosoma vivax]|nr:hypothetical protein TRVL_06385 [Trypanosoma vivax]